jgi:peptide/nickel transport system ATP-binding protein
VGNENDVLLDVRDLHKAFPLKGGGLLRRTVGYIRAVDGVTFAVAKGETVGVVGESGCGKTTLGRCIVRIYEPTSGEAYLNLPERSLAVHALKREDRRLFRSNVQMIFQDPYSSLDQHMNLLSLVGEPLLVNGIAKGKELEERVGDMIRRVGLHVEYLRRFPHSFSGGQRQRISIARTLIVNPKLLIADEPVSALDVSIQAQILNLLLDLQQDLGLSYLFVTHNMSVIRYVSDRILVMYAGKLVEVGPKEALLREPKHPYTEALLSAVPRFDRQEGVRSVTRGEPPDLLHLPPGCVFHPRCKYAQDVCVEEQPQLQPIARDHSVSCHLAEELELWGV